MPGPWVFMLMRARPVRPNRRGRRNAASATARAWISRAVSSTAWSGSRRGPTPTARPAPPGGPARRPACPSRPAGRRRCPSCGRCRSRYPSRSTWSGRRRCTRIAPSISRGVLM
jgi:hypothetical protein